MNYLVILNRKFPFKSGESFLENEIEEISKYFDKILIFPSDMTPKDTQMRHIRAKNVEVFTVETSPLKLRQLQYCLGGVFAKKDPAATGIRNWLYAGYFHSAANCQTKHIERILRQYSFTKEDNVVFYSYWFFISAKVAVSLKNTFGKTTNAFCVTRAHGFDIYEDKRYLPEREAILTEINAVFPCSDNGTAYLRNKYPSYAHKIRTSYLGTYDRGVDAYEKGSAFRLVSCSRIAPLKRVEKIIEALSLLRGEELSLQWTHIGGGERLEELRALAKSKLDFMTVQFTGTIPNQQVYDRYLHNHYDLFLNVSLTEGLPVSIMEAVSFGIPAVATDVGGSGEIVVEGVSGSLLRKDFEPEELADRIRYYATMEPGAYERLRSSTRALWCKKYEAAANYARFSKELLAICTRKNQ